MTWNDAMALENTFFFFKVEDFGRAVELALEMCPELDGTKVSFRVHPMHPRYRVPGASVVRDRDVPEDCMGFSMGRKEFAYCPATKYMERLS